MAPDHIAELALIEMSRMQREHGYDYAALEAYAAEQEKEKQHARAVSGPQERKEVRGGAGLGRLDSLGGPAMGEQPDRGEQEAA